MSEPLTYGRYLHLDALLGAQAPLSRPEAHDELLFIIQHQTSELWLKLALHELTGACDDLAADDLPPALKRLARVKHVQKQLIEQWTVLATLTPSEYQRFRGFLGSSSGFQSYQYRAVEFTLGAKDAGMLEVFADDEAARALLTSTLERPSLYAEFLRLLARRGHPVPADVLARDVREPHREDPRLVEVFRDLRRARAALGRLRDLRGARRHRGQPAAVALPPPQDRRTHHRAARRHRRDERRVVPAARARPVVLPRAVRRADGAVAPRRLRRHDGPGDRSAARLDRDG